MAWYIPVCFALGTGIELSLLLWISEYISVLNTFSVIMLTFLIGVVVRRSWGNEFFEKMLWHLKSRTLPTDETLNGAVMSVGGILLITPGIVTDLLGFLILIPTTRGMFKDIGLDWTRKKISSGQLYFFFKD